MTQKQYIGIREHAGTDFIVSPGRPDIWRKYIAGYEIIKFSITFHQENRILDASENFRIFIINENRIFDEKRVYKIEFCWVCINCVRIVTCGFFAKLFGPEF